MIFHLVQMANVVSTVERISKNPCRQKRMKSRLHIDCIQQLACISKLNYGIDHLNSMLTSTVASSGDKPYIGAAEMRSCSLQ